MRSRRWLSLNLTTVPPPGGELPRRHQRADTTRERQRFAATARSGECGATSSDDRRPRDRILSTQQRRVGLPERRGRCFRPGRNQRASLPASSSRAADAGGRRAQGSQNPRPLGRSGRRVGIAQRAPLRRRLRSHRVGHGPIGRMDRPPRNGRLTGFGRRELAYMLICMQSASVRIDVRTHEELKRLAGELNTTVGNAVSLAVRALRQDRVGADLARPLRDDEVAWLDADLG